MEAAAVNADDDPCVGEDVVGKLEEPHVLEPGRFRLLEEGMLEKEGRWEVYFEFAMR